MALVVKDVNAEDEAGIRASQAAIEELIAAEVGRGIPSERIALAGFSQGGAIALYAALRHQGRLAGIVALSTYLIRAERLSVEAPDAQSGHADLDGRWNAGSSGAP